MKVFKILTSLVILLFFISVTSNVFADMPEFSENESIYLIENSSSDIILNNQSEEKINSGEMNRLMAVLVSLDALGGKLSDKVIVGEEINNIESTDNLIGLEINQEISYQDLIAAILLTGSPDATQVLAYNIGNKIKGESKSDGSDYFEAFLKRMNEKSKELGLKSTNLTSVLGSQDNNNTTSVEDITLIGKTLLSNQSVKKVLSSDKYSIKLPVINQTKSSEQEPNSQDIETNETIETPTIDLTNRFLPIISSENLESIQDNINSEDEKQEKNEILDPDGSEETIELNTENELISSEEIQNESNTENKSNSDDLNSSAKLNKDTNSKFSSNKSLLKSAFIANENTDNAIILFESQANNADIIGCISGLGVYSLAEQINSINSELSNNYSFKDLVDQTGNLGTYSLNNTSLFSKKKLDLTVNNELKVFIPNSQKDSIKTNVIWDKNIIQQDGDKYLLLQSIDPGTQVAQLEISKGEVKRLVPLYSSTKASIKSWKDSILIFLFWSIIIIIPLILFWRIIYVRNRKKAIRRRRELRRKRRIKLQQENINNSPIDRMAHNI